MTRYTLYVPVKLNDGTTVPNRWTAQLEREIVDTFGGFTRTLAHGGWKAPDGRIILEPVALYAVDTDRDQSAMSLVAARVARELEQECVYLTAETTLKFCPVYLS